MSALLPLSPKVLADLHWEEVLSALASRARTEPGERRIRRREFCAGREAVELSLARGREIERLMLREGRGLPLSGIRDVVPILERASKGGILEPGDMLEAASAMKALSALKTFVVAKSELLPLSWKIAQDIEIDVQAADKIERSFDASGSLVDTASFELGPLRSKVKSLTRNIQGRLDALLHDEAFTRHLRENYYSVRSDRYVFPVLAQSRSAVPGIVHNASQSGQTLFVEPEALVSMGNDLAIAKSMVEEEERRILQELSYRLGKCLPQVSVSVEAASMLDEMEAQARLSADLSLSVPEIVEADAPFRLLAMRHPLLALKKGDRVVPNDVAMGEGERVLVISGPNAGGKTVTLTGLGLCALMLRFGLAIPAEKGSAVPLFSGVLSAVGDDQDLDRDLSTFSAHLSALQEIHAGASKGVLVLIDELASDTDPREGAALALAFLEDFSGRGARVVITTHLEELKALGVTRPGFINARVGFDAGSLSPTYRLLFGAPGLSSAIAIARRMGVSEAICGRARELLDRHKGPLSEALSMLEAAKREAEAEREKAAQKRRELENALQQVKAASVRQREKASAIEIEERQRLVRELDKVRAEVKAAIRLLQKAPSQKSASEARALVEKRLSEETRALEFKEAASQAEREEDVGSTNAAEPAKAAPGVHVRVPGLGDGYILELSGAGDEALIQLGALKVRRPVSELVCLRGGKNRRGVKENEHGQQRGKQAVRSKEGESSDAARVRAVQAGSLSEGEARIDLRGMRVDDALRLLETFLDRCLCEGERDACVIHGHGTGQLRSALREYLENSPYAASFQSGGDDEGGNGITRIRLKG